MAASERCRSPTCFGDIDRAYFEFAALRTVRDSCYFDCQVNSELLGSSHDRTLYVLGHYALARKPEADLTAEGFLNLARHRQEQSQVSFEILGGKKDDLIFLGYPDAGLDKVYDAKGKEPFKQKFTRKSETYIAEQPDYHSAVHGRPSPYTYDGALADVVELIWTFKPAEICVTNEGDEHLDHKAAFRFVRDALKAVGHPCELFEPCWTRMALALGIHAEGSL